MVCRLMSKMPPLATRPMFLMNLSQFLSRTTTVLHGGGDAHDARAPPGPQKLSRAALMGAQLLSACWGADCSGADYFVGEAIADRLADFLLHR